MQLQPLAKLQYAINIVNISEATAQGTCSVQITVTVTTALVTTRSNKAAANVITSISLIKRQVFKLAQRQRCLQLHVVAK